MTTTTIDVKTIAADIAREYREDQSRWTQHAWARDASGCETTYTHPRAACWCLRGAIDKRLALSGMPAYSEAYGAVYRVFDEALGFDPDPDGTLRMVSWNDTEGRTVQEVIALCEKVASS